MTDAIGQRRFRISIRTLMIAIALCAVVLTPLIWLLHRLELQVTMERIAADNARAQAERALYAAQLNSAQAAFSAAKPGTANQQKTKSVWAALSINHAVFQAGQTKDLRIEFSLVNDSDKVIDPKIGESQILINGRELADSNSIFGRVPKDVRVNALAPGESLRFDCLLGDHLKETGTYRISWKGRDFQSPEIVVRILAEKTR
jgi:hypothetical protein